MEILAVETSEKKRYDRLTEIEIERGREREREGRRESYSFVNINTVICIMIYF